MNREELIEILTADFRESLSDLTEEELQARQDEVLEEYSGGNVRNYGRFNSSSGSSSSSNSRNKKNKKDKKKKKKKNKKK